jgi:hypothetical protein
MPRQKTDAQLESEYQGRRLIPRLRRMFPGCIVEKWSDHRQGYSDLIIIWHGLSAVLEVKAHAGAVEQPNQREYIEQWNATGQFIFASFIYPENEEEVLGGLQRSFESARASCLSQS